MKRLTATWATLWALVGGGGIEAGLAQTVTLPPMPGEVRGDGARIVFANPVFDFGRLANGEVVRHDFVFTNAGDAVLEVTAVHASCGCTTTGEWSRRVEPGQTGTIPIQFNSGTFSGTILKTATVQCNDKTQPTVTLQIKATIWKPVDVSPQYAVLQVTSESVSNATSTIRIVNNLDQPLTLFPPESQNPHFAAVLKTNQAGKEYELIVRAVPPLDGPNKQGQISLKTSLTNPASITVTAMALLQPDFVIMPAQIALPASSPAQDWTTVVTIRNQLNAPFKLSEPKTTVDGVRLQLTEVEAGRSYTLTATFPAGLEWPGGVGECTLQSSQPRHPVVKIPIMRAR